MKIYIIYKHTILKTNKSYIGFTTLTMEERLLKHVQNSLDGITTKFYNAFRKYCFYEGVYVADSIKSEMLTTCSSQKDAYDLEEHMINLYDTYKTGYNSIPRGGGGWLIGSLSKEKQKAYFAQLSERSIGNKNPNHSGYTDDEIVDLACVYYKKIGIFGIRQWIMFCKENKYPQSYSKCRFNGEGFQGLMNRMCEKLNVESLQFYKITEEHKKKLSNSNKSSRWLFNTITKEIVKDKNLNKYDFNIWKIGRK